MKKIFFLILFSNLVFGQNEPKISAFNAERIQKLNSFLEDYTKTGKAPNAVYMIIKDNKVVAHEAFGYKNLENKTPLKKDDIFRIASQTKLLTTLCVMMLMEEGHFYLDEPISKFIPAFADPKIYIKGSTESEYTLKPASKAITIRHLLSHTAGIPYEHPLDKVKNYDIPFFNSVKNEKLEDVVNSIAQRPLISEPGEKFIYGLNTDILGRLVEIVSGKSLSDFMTERLLKPLGMKDTHFYLPKEKAGRLVELYSKEKISDQLTVHKNDVYRNYAISGSQTFYSGGAGLLSTVADYAKVCQLVLNHGKHAGKQIVSRKSIAEMTKNQIGGLEVWDRQDKFGLGLEIASENSHYLDLASAGSLSWGGMYCSEFTIDPKENLTFLFFTNVHPYGLYSDLTRKFRIMVYQSLN